MAALPTGTVTLLFTDVSASAQMAVALGERYGRLLTESRRLLRETFGRHGGLEVESYSDSGLFVFTRARAAVEAAAEAQRALYDHDWPDGDPVRVAIALHTGEPHLEEGSYVGVDAVRAALICAEAGAGEVLVSDTTRQLVEADLPAGLRCATSASDASARPSDPSASTGSRSRACLPGASPGRCARSRAERSRSSSPTSRARRLCSGG
jgi:class 3 adenylate cyclase